MFAPRDLRPLSLRRWPLLNGRFRRHGTRRRRRGIPYHASDRSRHSGRCSEFRLVRRWFRAVGANRWWLVAGCDSRGKWMLPHGRELHCCSRRLSQLQNVRREIVRVTVVEQQVVMLHVTTFAIDAGQPAVVDCHVPSQDGVRVRWRRREWRRWNTSVEDSDRSRLMERRVDTDRRCSDGFFSELSGTRVQFNGISRLARCNLSHCFLGGIWSH